jgi:SAM-dependent methyltransferase
VIERRVAGVLRRAGLLRAAYSLYERSLALGRWNEPHADEDGLPLPPARLRVRVGPRFADRDWFLESGRSDAALLARVLAESGAPIEDARALLDFGCGVGRVLRHWRRLERTEVHGTDTNEPLVRWVAANLPFARAATNGPEPPLRYGDGSFDAVYALSVFTHLPEAAQRRWLDELARILRPGGHVLLTTHGDHFADRLTDDEAARFRAGELVVLNAEGAGTGLCSAYHPPAYVRQRLAPPLDAVGFHAAAMGGQDLHVLRKESSCSTT